MRTRDKSYEIRVKSKLKIPKTEFLSLTSYSFTLRSTP